MNTLAWILILLAGLIMRAVARGRVMEIPEDLSDSFLALLRGDTKGFTEVLARTGDANKASTAIFDQATVTNTLEDFAAANSIATGAMQLGKAAKGYRFGATGPDYYDCSGLMWRACQKVGYKGSRFTTFTIQSRKEFVAITGRTELAVKVGDIVLWPTHHMGVYTGPNRFYSARNPRSGISEASITGFRKEQPVYLRYVGYGKGGS